VEEGASGYKPGWMLKADPKLKAKVDANKAKNKEFKKLVGTKVDREPKGEYDRKVDSYLKKKYNKEEVELEEDMKSAAKELNGYASKYGGMDKSDFLKAAKHMETGNHKALQNLIKNLDTDPRDKILTTLHKHGNDIKRYGYKAEEVELDESVGKIAQAHGFKKGTGWRKGSYIHPKTGHSITPMNGNTFGHSNNSGGTVASGQHKDGLEKHLAKHGYTKESVNEVWETDKGIEQKRKVAHDDTSESTAAYAKSEKERQEREARARLTKNDRVKLDKIRAMLAKEKK
jgi:hypothetical protein